MKIVCWAILLATFFSCSKSQLPQVEIESSIGTIVLEIDSIHAPVTARNFLDLVDKGVYLNASFYRVVRMDNQPDNDVKIEVIQGGLYDDDLIDQYPGIPHETTDETGIKHKDGVLSMARYTPGTACTEFFICVGDQPDLDFGGKRNPDGQGFAAFGKVVSGMEVVRQIHQYEDEDQYLDEPIRIYNIKRIHY